MIRRLLTAVFAATALVALLAPAGASARRFIPIVRDGFYGGSAPGVGTPSPPDLALIQVRHHAVSALRFSVLVHCHDVFDGEYHDLPFLAGFGFPRGTRIPRSGRLELSWPDHDGGRLGNVTGDIDWRGSRPKATFVVSVDHTATDGNQCTGVGIVALRYSRRQVLR